MTIYELFKGAEESIPHCKALLKKDITNQPTIPQKEGNYMATIVANGNASVMSRAMMDTDDGYFEHTALFPSQKAKMIQKNTGFTGKIDKPMVFGPKTAWKDGTPYPDKNWAQKGIQPVKHPYIEGRWIDPNELDKIKNAYKNKSNAKAYSVTKNALNAVTGTVGKEVKGVHDAGMKAKQEYIDSHKNVQIPPKSGFGYPTFKENTGTKLGEAMAYARGAAGNTAIARGVRNEVGNIRGGADTARQKYDKEHGEKGNAFGRTMATVGGGIKESAVGRAGKAAFDVIIRKFKDFKEGIEKYLTGDNAKANRSQALKDLNEKGGALIGNIRSALGRLGTSEGRTQALDKVTGTIGGTVIGVARGIASSDIGKAAYNSGKNAYGAVKDKVFGALDNIKKFFENKKKNKNLKKEMSAKAYPETI